ADNGEVINAEQRRQSFRRHFKPTDTAKNEILFFRLQRPHQRRPQAVAGFLARDQKNLHMSRIPITNKPALSAASISACGSATMVPPAMTAMPFRPACVAPSTVRGPIEGRSKR